MRLQNQPDSVSKTKEFIELWIKFNQVYKDAMGKNSISPEEEVAFLETKSIIARKFQTLAESLSIDRGTIDHTYDVINQILSLKSISTLSEQSLKKIDNDWHQAYISLNRLVGHLEAEKEKVVQEAGPVPNVFSGVLKGVAYLGGALLIALIILFLAYILGILK